MRVRIAKGFWWRDGNANMRPGELAEVPDADAQLWLRHGMAMEDKTEDVPENKGEVVEGPPQERKPLPPDIATKPRRKKKAKK